MILCHECTFWAQSGREQWALGPNDTHLGECLCPKWLAGYNVDAVPLDGVVVEDDEGWGFMTGPEFGCIHGTPPDASL